MNKNIKIVSSALLSSLLIAGYALPIHAEGEEETTTVEETETVESSGVNKNESVYAVLNADGSVKTVTVSDTLHSDNGFDNYSDTTSLSNIENLKSNDEVDLSNGVITWNSDATDIYYQGTSTKELPLDVSIKYYLNDKEYDPNEMAGKSGHVKIKIEVTNNSKHTYTVNDKTYDLVTPFITAAGLMMDEDNFSNVEVNQGTVSSDSSHSIVAAVMIPGLREGLESTVDADIMSKISDYLIDDITIEADTENFESPTMMLAAATSTDALEDQFEGTDISSLFDQLDELKDATNQLITGTQSLYDGAIQLNDGVGTLQSGANTLNSGASSLYDGASSLSTGANSLYAGLTQINANSATLNAGMDTLAASILATVNKQLTENGFGEITWDNYADKLASEEYIGLNETQLNAAKEEIRTSASLGTSEDDNKNLDTLIYMAALKMTSTSSTDEIKGYLNDAGTQLVQAKTIMSSEAYQNGVGVIASHIASGDYSDTLVQSTFTGMKNIALQQAYATAISTIKSAITTTTIDDDTAAKILSYACENPVSTNPLDETNISNAAQMVLSGQGSTSTIGLANPYVQKVLSSAAMQKMGLSDLSDASLYNYVKAQLINSGATEATAPLVFGYACALNNGNYTAETASTYFNTAASNLNALLVIQQYQSDAQANPQTIKGLLLRLVSNEASSQLSEAVKTLTSTDALVKGVKSYTAAVDTATQGAASLASGAAQVADGSKQLKEGTDSLSSGVDTLKSGSEQLAEGAKTLKDGMEQYNDEAISKLTNNSKISTIEDLSDLFTEIQNSDDNYSNYSGISEGTEGSVKFIYKVNGVESTESTTSTTTDTEESEEKESFWDRIVGLFNISTLFNKDE